MLKQEPGLMSAVRVGLSSLFEKVRTVRRADEAADSDLLVVATPVRQWKKHPRQIGLSLDFKDPVSGKSIVPEAM